MRFTLKKSLLHLILTLTLTIAIPFSSTTNPSLTSIPPLSSSSLLTSTPATQIAADAAASYDPSTCPPAHASKQCCTSLAGVADNVVGELGTLVPYLSGVQVSSSVGLQCTSMTSSEPTTNCSSDVMCCSAEGEGGAQKPGTQALFKGGCIPYDDAMQDKKDAVATSTPTPALASASASASAAASKVV